MSSRGVSTSNCYAYFFKYPLFFLNRSYQICTLAFIFFRECLYLCILFLLLQPETAQNEPVPLGAMLTRGAVRDNLPRPSYYVAKWYIRFKDGGSLILIEVGLLLIYIGMAYFPVSIGLKGCTIYHSPVPLYSYA